MPSGSSHVVARDTPRDTLKPRDTPSRDTLKPRDRMDGNQRFRSIVSNGNPRVLMALLGELGQGEAKSCIEDCYK